MTDEGLSSLAIPHIPKHKNVDWQVGNGVCPSLLVTCLLCFCTTFYCIFATLFIENALQKNQEMAFPRP